MVAPGRKPSRCPPSGILESWLTSFIRLICGFRYAVGPPILKFLRQDQSAALSEADAALTLVCIQNPSRPRIRIWLGSP
jgi:hypothetical protein